MKNKLIPILAIIGFCFIFPTAFTLFWNGDKQNVQVSYNSGKTVTINSKNSTTQMDIEEFIPCVLANQLSINSPKEAIKAQAIIIRTYILHYMDTNNNINANELNLPYTLYDSLKNLVGDEYADYHTILKEAVYETKGLVIKYNGDLIIPYFHALSAGKTRSGKEALGSEDYPYLVSKDSKYDTEARNFATISYVDKNDFVQTLKSYNDTIILSKENPLENMQVLKRCSANYIASIQIGDATFTGDEIQMLFSLNSPYFELENFENQVRIITKGNGHGLGLSINGACVMANNGSTYTDILTYYYEGITIEK